MALPEWIAAFVEPLDRLGIDHMITGSVGAMAYGEPRATLDIDIVIRMREGHVEPFLAAFREERFYCPPADVVRREIARPARGHFNIIHHETGMKADFYPVGRDPLPHRALERCHTLDGLVVAPAEYVIVRKLEYHREGQSPKHLRDIAAIIASGCDLDRTWLESELSSRGLMEAWQTLLREAG